MSAHIVEQETINLIINYYAIKRETFDYKGRTYSPQQAGQILVDENYRSVNFRYREDTKPETFKYKPILSKTLFFTDRIGHNIESLGLEDIQSVSALDPLLILRLIDYYDYQTCETNDYQETMAYWFIQQIKNRCIRQLTEHLTCCWGREPKSKQLEDRYRQLHKEKTLNQIKER